MATFTTTVLPDTGHQHQLMTQSTHDKKKCTSASCCSPSRLWKSIQQFLSHQDKQGLEKLCQDEEKQTYVLRVLLTSRYHNDPARYGASNKHLVLNLSDKMVGASVDNTALSLSNTIKRRKLVYEKFGKPLTDLNALQLAILYRNEDIVLYLLDLMHQHATTKEFNSFIHHQCGKQISSLHLAGFLALPKVVDKLLSFGMDPQLKNGRMKTPLDCTDHLDCRQLLENAIDSLNPPPPLNVITTAMTDSDSEMDSIAPTTPTEMNLIDLDVNENEMIMVSPPPPPPTTTTTPPPLMAITDLLVMNVASEKGKDELTSLNDEQQQKRQSSTTVNAKTFDLDLTDTWMMDVLDDDDYNHQTIVNKPSGFDWLTPIALNDTWFMDTLKNDQVLSTPMTATTKASDLRWLTLNGTWLMNLKDDGGSTYSSSSSSTTTTTTLHDTWLMDVWKENNSSHHHHHLDLMESNQQLLPDLQFFDLMKNDDVMATPPLSPVQDDDDDDDNESMNLDELPDLELGLGNDHPQLHDHGDTKLVPLLFNVNDLKSPCISFNYQPQEEKRKYENGDPFMMMNNRNEGGTTNPHSHLVFNSPPSSKLNDHSNSSVSSPTLHSSLNQHQHHSPSSFAFDDDHGGVTRSSSLNDHHYDNLLMKNDSSNHPLLDTSPPSLNVVNDQLNDSSSTHGGTTILDCHQYQEKLQDHDPPNHHHQVKQDHRAVHFDPKVVLMETCIRGDLKELVDTLQHHQDLNHDLSWLFNHYGNAGVHDRTLLQLALLNGHESIVHYLVNHVKVNVNQVDADGWTALHYAAALGQWKIAEYLASLHFTDLFAQTDDGYLYEDCTRSKLDRIRCQWLLDRAMMNHSLYTTNHHHLRSHSTLTSSTSPLMCG